MYKVHCLNNISAKGLELLDENYQLTDNVEEADVILVRSANMHEMDIPANLKAVARAGAGVNNIPLEKLAEAGVAVFNTPGANANAVKELVLAGMLLASRDIIGGVEWCRDNARLRDRLRQPRRDADAPCHRHPAPGSFHRGSRRQLRHHGSARSNGLPGRWYENALCKYVRAPGNINRSATRGGQLAAPLLLRVKEGAATREA